jgi:hypothetical protein
VSGRARAGRACLRDPGASVTLAGHMDTTTAATAPSRPTGEFVVAGDGAGHVVLEGLVLGLFLLLIL